MTLMSFNQWVTMREARHVPDNAIHVDLPSVRQQRSHTCAAACLRAICKFFKVGSAAERDFAKKLDSHPEGGTAPADIVKTCEDWGLGVEAKEKMTIKQLKNYVKSGVPVICAMQAWGSPKQYSNDQSGHYVVAIGYDDRNVYFMDPAMVSGSRGFLPDDVFVSRWHDEDKHGEKFSHLGISVWTNEPDKEKQDLHKVKKID